MSRPTFSSRRRASTRAGFTMIELLIAILLLLIGIVAVAKLVPVAIESNFRNRNDSTALIVAQRELDQMAQMPLDALGTNCPLAAAAPAGQYYFCDSDGDVIPLGAIDASGGASVTRESGCALAGDGQLNFGGACDPGYSVNKQWQWNPSTGTTRTFELRIRVISWHVNNEPVRKVFIVGARGGPAGQGLTVTNLQSVVGR